MKLTFKFCLGISLFIFIRLLYAEVVDNTDPSHPVLISSTFSLPSDNFIADPSFDCKKAITDTEKIICESEILARMDRRLAVVYRGLLTCLPPSEMQDIKNDQSKWIAARGTCGDHVSCVQGSFAQRIDILVALYDQKCITISKKDVRWRTYRNKQYRFEISYPSDMTLSKEFIGHYHLMSGVWSQVSGITWDNNDTGVPVISVIVYRPNGTSYPDEEIRVGVHAAQAGDDPCGWKKMDGKKRKINNQLFQEFEISHSGMMQYASGTSYQTLYKGYCYALEDVSAGTTASDALEEEKSEKVHASERVAAARRQQQVDKIVESFKFLDH